MKELKPTLDQEGIRLVAIGIGYPEIGKEFCEHTGGLLHLKMFLPVAHSISFEGFVHSGGLAQKGSSLCKYRDSCADEGCLVLSHVRASYLCSPTPDSYEGSIG